MEDGEWIEIATGLSDGETVAVSALNRLSDGMTVQAQAVQAQENTTVQAQ